MLRSRKGFTLVEMIVVMTVFIIVIMITGEAFKTILSQMAKVSKSEESNIEGVLGLEMLRHDIAQIGYGLPFSYLDATDSSLPKPDYTEATVAPASSYNDSNSASRIPRAIVAGNDLSTSSASDGSVTYNILAGTDYLALKASSLGLNDTAKKWSYIPYSSGGGRLLPHIWPSENLSHSNDIVIVMRRAFIGSEYVNQMVYNTTTPSIYWARYYADGFADTAFNPSKQQDIHYLYGIKSYDSNGLGMPFNRADYFVAVPQSTSRVPTFCAPSTGILYKGTVNHVGGALTYVPILDCVADMQVVFGWDLYDGMSNPGQDGSIETYSNPDGTTVSPSSSQAEVQSALSDPEKIRKSLKIIKVYILAQTGRRDPGYQSAASFVVGNPAADQSVSKTYTFANPDMRNYRWKVYQLSVRPKNLFTNQ